MQKSKGMALVFLLVAFLAGGALGYAAERMMGRSHSGPWGGGGGKQSMSARIAKELDLTPVQRASLDSLMARRRAQIREVYRPIRPQLDSLDKIGRSISESTHAQVRRILTAEQQVKWDAMRDRARKAEATRKRNSDRR